jgi:hypothetical protein
MPSGFQQDQNQLTPSYYRVNINCGAGDAEWYAEGNGNPDGTNEGRISAYAWDNFAGSDRPTTQSEADALARGNLRFQYIVEALSNLADCQILDIEHNAIPTSMHDNSWINFTVKFDRDEGVLPALIAIKKAQDWGTNGTNTITYDNVQYPQYYAYVDNGDTVNNVEDAIRDVIWVTLRQYDPYTDTTNTRSRSTRVFQPVLDSDPLEGEGIQAVITTATPWDDNNNAWNDISVNEINGTTTTITNDC